MPESPPPQNNSTLWDAIVNGIKAFGGILIEVNEFKALLLVVIVGIVAVVLTNIYGKNPQVVSPYPAKEIKQAIEAPEAKVPSLQPSPPTPSQEKQQAPLENHGVIFQGKVKVGRDFNTGNVRYHETSKH
jgi:hypothetical protein